MADQVQDTPRIESLRQKLSTDPSSRVFYQLGEELRKAERFDEAEKILREGLEKHPDYLSAWVSLGRVLAAQQQFDDAVKVLMEGLALDPQNVVTARLLADCHYERRDPVESIKKYKLVRALLPTDEEVAERIALLEAIIVGDRDWDGSDAKETGEAPADAERDLTEEPASPAELPSLEDHRSQGGVALDETPGPDHDQLEDRAELTEGNEGESEAEEDRPTVTMGNLYAEQGHLDEARRIFEKVLERDPDNEEARARLEAMTATSPAASSFEQDDPDVFGAGRGESHDSVSRKTAALENWLRKVGRR